MAIFKRNTVQAASPRPTLKQRASAIPNRTATILHLPIKRRVTAENADAQRRVLMVGSLATAATVIPLPAFGGGEGDGVTETYLQWRALMVESRELSRAYDAAHKSLPWWADSGPEELNHKGEHVGCNTGWPARQDLEPPTLSGAIRRLRPSPYCLKSDFEQTSRLFGRKRAIGPYCRELRAYVLRKRAQVAEQQRVGIPDLEARMAVNDDRFGEIEETLAAFPLTLNGLAARLVVELDAASVSDETLSDDYNTIEWTLAAIRPALGGVILRDVSEILDGANDPVAEVFERWFGSRESDLPERPPVVTPRVAERALTVYAACPAGCLTFPVAEKWAEPDLNPGEQAVVHPADCMLEDRALYLIQSDSGARSIQIARSREMGREIQWWFTDSIMPQPGADVIRSNDGPYRPDQLETRMVGRVVGVIPAPAEAQPQG
jgi:hypothetical protein